MIFSSPVRLCLLAATWLLLLSLGKLSAIPDAQPWAAATMEDPPYVFFWAVSPNGEYYAASDWDSNIQIFKGAGLEHVKTLQPRLNGSSNLKIISVEVDDRGEVSATIYQTDADSFNPDTIEFYKYDSAGGSLTLLHQAESAYWNSMDTFYDRESDLFRIRRENPSQYCFFDANTGELVGVDPFPNNMDGPFVQRRDHRVYLEDYRYPGPFLVQGMSPATVSEFLPAEHLPDGAVFWAVAHNSGGYIGALYELSGDLRFRVWLLSDSGVYVQQYDVPSDLELQPQFDPILYPNYLTDPGMLFVALDDTDIANPVIPTQNYELWSTEIPIHFDLDLSLHIGRNLFPFINDYHSKPLDEQYLAVGYFGDEDMTTNFVDIFDRQTGEMVLRINGAVTATFSTEEPKRITTYMRNEQVILRDFPSGAPIANLGQFDYFYNGYSIDNLEVGLQPLGERPSLRLRVDNNDVTVFDIQDPLRQYVEKPATPTYHITGAPSWTYPNRYYNYLDVESGRYYVYDGSKCYYWELPTERGPIDFPVRDVEIGDTFAHPLNEPGPFSPDFPRYRLSKDESTFISLDFGEKGAFYQAWPAGNALLTVDADTDVKRVIDADDFSLLATHDGALAEAGNYLLHTSGNGSMFQLTTYNADLQIVDSIPDLKAELVSLGGSESGIFHRITHYHDGTQPPIVVSLHETTNGYYRTAVFGVDATGHLVLLNLIELGISKNIFQIFSVSTERQGDYLRLGCQDGFGQVRHFYVDLVSGVIVHQSTQDREFWISRSEQKLWLVNADGLMEIHDLTGLNPAVVGGEAGVLTLLIDADSGIFLRSSYQNGFVELVQAPAMQIVATLRDRYNLALGEPVNGLPIYQNGQITHLTVNQLMGEISIFELSAIQLSSENQSPAEWLTANNLPDSADLENDASSSGGQALAFEYLTGEPDLGASAIDQLTQGGDWLYRVRSQSNGWSLQAKVSKNLLAWTTLTLPPLFQDDEYIYFDAPEGFGDSFRFIQFNADAPLAP